MYDTLGHCRTIAGRRKYGNIHLIIQPSISLGCPPGHIAYGNKCYRLYGHPDALRYNDAKSKCFAEGRNWGGGGQLADISDINVHQFLTQQSFR